jgi:hypothetical protein
MIGLKSFIQSMLRREGKSRKIQPDTYLDSRGIVKIKYALPRQVLVEHRARQLKRGRHDGAGLVKQLGGGNLVLALERICQDLSEARGDDGENGQDAPQKVELDVGHGRNPDAEEEHDERQLYLAAVQKRWFLSGVSSAEARSYDG